MRQTMSNQELPFPDAYNATPAQIPEDLDLPVSSDVSGAENVLPPHIAARFYHPANNRRKSSAASSRRNSLSSQHSHHSNCSFHGGPPSTYIAQHLRRASIMETRKARLADRAAHAEKVRYRAQVAKTAPRFSNCEERVLAAAQARERYLAQVTASCAEEVKRAKKVAEDMKEKKAAEGRRMREELEDKFAEAEKRRLEYKRSTVKKGKAMNVLIETAAERRLAQRRLDLDDEAAARLIQSTWRTSKNRRTVTRFRNLGLSIQNALDISFDELTKLLSKEEVLDGTAKMLTLCGLEPADKHQETSRGTMAVRNFLSAFLILSHPAQILSKQGQIEQDLVAQSRSLLETFELLVSRLTLANAFGGSPLFFEKLTHEYACFIETFGQWKGQDVPDMVKLMLAQFIELEGIWQKVRNVTEGGVADDYAEGIQNNKALIFAKMKRLVGKSEAGRLIKEAIRTVPRTKLKPTTFASSVEPRLATEVLASHNGAVSSSSLDDVDSSPTHNGNASPSIAQQSRPASTADSESQGIDQLLKVASSLPDNRTLIHEIAIKEEYTVDPQQQSSVYRDTFASMRNVNNAGQLSNEWVLPLVSAVRDQLLRLFISDSSSLYQSIEGTLDLDIVAANLKRGVPFDLAGFCSYIQSIVPKLCQPARDAHVKMCIEDNSGDLFDRGARMLDLISLLSLDHANFLLRMSAPDLIKEAPGYEERRFAQGLENGIITLQKTEHWWKQARARILVGAPLSDAVTFTKFYMEGLTDISIAATSLNPDDIPETLELDVARLGHIRSRVLQLVTIGSILTVAKNLLKRDTRTPWSEQASRIKTVLETEGYLSSTNSTPETVQRILEQAHSMPPATKNLLLRSIERYLTQANSKLLTDAFMNTILRRLRSHIFARLSASSIGERTRIARDAADRLTDIGLLEFVDEVAAIVKELERIADVDQQAHQRWYNIIAERTASTN
ncbi:MAG: hypothetical protein M1812_006786 [Candelaria pacifica]|nr:MAG: hypothetical protein M1812_006786 [Candelaria pacifica]